MKKKNYFILFLSIAFWVSASVVQVTRFNETADGAGVPVLLNKLWHIQYSLQHFIAVLIIIYNFKQRKHIENFMKMLNDFDKKAEKFGWKFATGNGNFWVLVLVSLCLIMTPSSVIISILIDDQFFGYVKVMKAVESVLFLIIYALVNAFYLLLALQFSVSANQVWMRLKCLVNFVQ